MSFGASAYFFDMSQAGGMSFKKSSSSSAPPEAPAPVAIPNAGDSELDARDELEQRKKKKQGISSTILSPRVPSLAGDNTKPGQGNSLRQTLG
ncbi:MAG: hypothetical protein RR553_03240 [Akkermansia sp.]